MSHTIVRGGLVLDIAAGSAEPADILIEDDTIREIGPPGCAAPDDATEITAARRLVSPEENNERQPIHEHESVALAAVAPASPRTVSPRSERHMSPAAPRRIAQ